MRDGWERLVTRGRTRDRHAPSAARRDLPEFFRLISSACLLLPVSTAAAEGREPVSWFRTTDDQRSYLPVFTSPEALLIGMKAEIAHYRDTHFRDLAAAWPDLNYLMLLDPLTPLQWPIAGPDLIRLASAPVVDILDHPGTDESPAAATVVYKFLSVGQSIDMLRRNEARVSGYVIAYEQITHLDSFDSLMKGLGLDRLNPGIDSNAVSICAMRWPVVGKQLYRIPYGGTSVEAMAAARGWVVEGQPFHGTGFVDGALPAVQLYWVQALRMPHGAELVEISEGHRDELIASYDADRQTWTWDSSFFGSINDVNAPINER